MGPHQVAIEGEGEEEGNKEAEGKQEQEPLELVRQSLTWLRVGKVQPGQPGIQIQSSYNRS